MMRFLAGFCVAAVTGSAALAGQAVLTGSAALRSGPDPLYEALATGSAGTVVETVEGTVGWTLVRLPGGPKGWVRDTLLASPGTVLAGGAKPAPDAPSTAALPFTSVVWPGSGRLNLRAGPGTAHDVVMTMERGDWVRVTEETGAWVRVEHQSGATGWTYRKYLSR